VECDQSVPITDLKKRLEQLISIGRDLTHDYVTEDRDLLPNVKKWAAQCQIVLEKAFGKKSIFLTDFQGVLKDYSMDYHADYGVPIIEAACEELDLGEKSGKLDEIEKEIKEGKAEAQRRATVAESKFWGSVIELIQMQRDELKRRTQVDQQISEIQKQLAEIKQLLSKLSPTEKEQ